MRTSRATEPAGHFLGVRLTLEELALLDRFRESRELTTRSDAVRALVRAADRLARGVPDLPVGLQSRLEELTEDGYANNLDGALTLVLTYGLDEVGRVHSDRHTALRKSARETAERRQTRRRADREGRELLER
ncbi:MAG: hypothetical protein L3K19_04460 [Thermoplasmata archaeon]|nr:hypothetical protein [Thermoplasmata archaeon]